MHRRNGWQDRLKVREIIIRSRYIIEGREKNSFNQVEYEAFIKS